MLSYEEIKAKAIEIEGACRMFQYAAHQGNQEKIDEYLDLMWNKSFDIVKSSSYSLSACVCFCRATSMAFDYYVENNSSCFVALIGKIIMNEIAPTLCKYPDNENAQCLLLKASCQLLKGVDDFGDLIERESEDEIEIEIMRNIKQAAVQICFEVAEDVKNINAENILLQQCYPYICDVFEYLEEDDDFVMNEEINQFDLLGKLNFVTEVLDCYS